MIIIIIMTCRSYAIHSSIDGWIPQDFTMGASFGAKRELTFLHEASGQVGWLVMGRPLSSLSLLPFSMPALLGLLGHDDDEVVVIMVMVVIPQSFSGLFLPSREW